MNSLPKWKCHKTVRAGKILFVGSTSLGIEGEERTREVSPGFFARGRPSVGDYFVIYGDDYISWSPAIAFEVGYTREEQ